MALLLLQADAVAQFKERKNFTYKNNTYDVLTLRIDTALFRKLRLLRNDNRLSEADFFSNQPGKPPYFAITACIVDTACMPLGLCIQDGQKIKDINLDTGKTNFYLKPNGFFAADSSRIIIAESSTYDPSHPWLFALQSGPMLLINKTMHPGFSKKSENRNIRCGVGLYTQKKDSFLVFIKSVTPVTFYEFATLFAEKFNCDNALTLESGSNASMHLPAIDATYRSTPAACIYLFITW
jgi:uncharacterized protein YigE (DUF2233 family)